MTGTRGRLSHLEGRVDRDWDARADLILALRRCGPATAAWVAQHCRAVRRMPDVRSALEALAAEGVVRAEVRSEPVRHGSGDMCVRVYYSLA